METRKIWLRVGMTITANEEEIESLFDDNKGNETLFNLLHNNKFSINGNCYIPECEVEKYNDKYDTDHDVGDYEFNL